MCFRIFRAGVFGGAALALAASLLFSPTRQALADDGHNLDLHVQAAINNFNAMWHLLTGHNIPANPLNDQGETPLHIAASNGHSSVVTALLSRPAGFNGEAVSVSFSGDTPLLSAAKGTQDETTMNSLLNADDRGGAAADNNGDTALHLLRNPSADFVDNLVAHGADINARNNKGETPLRIAVNLRVSPQYIQILAARGGEINCPEGKEGSADHMCVCAAGKVEVEGGDSCVCPNGQTEAGDACVPDEAAQACRDANWEVDDGGCQIPVSNRGTVFAACLLGGGEAPQCADVFGADLNFPAKPAERFPVAAYVFNCGSGNIPATLNVGGKTTCECPGAGEVWLNGACAEGTDENRCRAKGWEFGSEEGADVCRIRSFNAAIGAEGGRFSNFCALGGGGACRGLFGATLNFPRRPADNSSPYYAANCGRTAAENAADSRNGLSPASLADGATECACDEGETRIGGAEFVKTETIIVYIDGIPFNRTYRSAARAGGGCFAAGETADAAQKCADANWEIVADADGEWECRIPVMRGTLAAGAADGCFFSGAASPQCADVFGAQLSFPRKPAAAARYAYDCDADGTTGHLPATHNTEGRMRCECPAGHGESEGVCRAECPSGQGAFDGVCMDCPAGETPLENICATPLAREIAKPSPDLATVRALLAAGADADGAAPDGIPLLPKAAALGHAEVVSVLVTVGANPAAANPLQRGRNVAHMMAAWNGADDGVSRETKWNVLRHFGDALEIRATLFDWNAPHPGGASPIHLLRAAANRTGSPDADPDIVAQTADYILSKGGRCGANDIPSQRYHRVCVGTAGKALADLVNTHVTVREVSAEEVRAAAQAMADAGIPVSLAGVPRDFPPQTTGGDLSGLAASNRQALAISVLMAAGADPYGEWGYGGTAPHWVGAVAARDAAKALAVLRHFVGGLSVAGKLDSFDGWRRPYGVRGDGPLDSLRVDGARLNTAEPEALFEIRGLLYDLGARCLSDAMENREYCDTPEEDIRPPSVWRAGAVLTLSRARLGFNAPPVPAETNSSLSANGWALALEADADPARLVLSRERNFQTGDAPAVFTVTMTGSYAPDPESRIVRVSALAAADPDFENLVSAVLEGDAATVLLRLRAEFTDAETADGIPLLMTAAALGHAEVVSVLITAGFNPDARLTSFHGANIPLLMAVRDGAAQPDGSGQLSREKRREVLFHFGGALEVRGTMYHNWNLKDDNNSHFSQLLQASESGGHGPVSVLLDMSDYALSRGMNCNAVPLGSRYGKYCVGRLGASLVAVVENQSSTAEDIRAAARAMTEANISVSLAGVARTNLTTEIVGVAIEARNAVAISILLTFGGNPDSRGVLNRTAPHHAATEAGQSPPRGGETGLNLLRHFIGGLSVAGKFGEYRGWNTTLGNNTPLDLLQQGNQPHHPEATNELGWLLYELGARCNQTNGTYCDLPREEFNPPPFAGHGAALTMTARTFSAFRAPFAPAETIATLAAHGWALTLRAEPEPDEVVLSRARAGLETDAPAVFTVTLASSAGVAAGEASREMRVSLAAAVCAADKIAGEGACVCPPRTHEGGEGVCVAGCAPGEFEYGLENCVSACPGEAAASADNPGRCECPPPNIQTEADCMAPSAEVCGDLSPPEFYDEANSVCVPFLSCEGGGEVLDAEANECVCVMGRIREEGADGACACPDSRWEVGGLCLPRTGGFDGVGQAALCEVFGGEVAAEGDGEVCVGLDWSGTFCILDSPDAFPCRGLFKRLRTCNAEHHRPLLNPFICAARCKDNQTPLGKECV